ncbi:long-chain fatty acid--CoA ligase [Gammaproteobacteria bacterium]|nr:long-chain fatty acid--CoA ligase [Gammaproteobacteria bacterium]MDA9364921.1 long-chain fatty acid--CoA ligase [Gammaproteobacteria bacterium]MDA9371192.1 long-chain fatty acid--CoA ligase [Gammaproteobacteria bacterium]MDC1326120.1 long-chain fatty acid--CoA ligase [Gammaproteobacteria bacterium]MDC1525295.1 long-chain fatty acid--CoA ligase [Gammaproteobacteria bacterium]|tara:strand:- start:2691 stop:4307 length:1617 start_codon:yes stop_codon:yes gene_type:complete
MKGNMMNWDLTIPQAISHAEKYNFDGKLISREVDGSITSTTYGASIDRSKKLANALIKLGVKQHDRVGTIAWNNSRHFETYFAVSGMGAILHTMNPRYSAEQLIYILNHAEDRVLILDPTFIPLIESIQDKLQFVEVMIIACNQESIPVNTLKNTLAFDELIQDEPAFFNWPVLDENTAASLCYTSGTTGNPKGVLYSHKSTILHAITIAGSLGFNSSSSVLPVVPMFHVNAWGVPYAALINGFSLTLPGQALDGESLFELIEQESVDSLLGVPTVWLGLLKYLEDKGKRLDSVDQVLVGGSAAPYAMIKAFDEQHGAFLTHGWGMTEMSPLGTINAPTKKTLSMPTEERYQLQTKQGYPLFGVEIKTVNDQGEELPRDGETSGALKVKGPWIMHTYYKAEESAVDDGGWFDTGDVATIHSDGCMQIVDRAKDVIKTGGEWISSIDLENAILSHDNVLEACVVGVPHPKWDERPLLFLITKDGNPIDPEEVNNFLKEKVVKWWLPDDIIFVDELPHGATGKLLKVELREQYKDHLMER